MPDTARFVVRRLDDRRAMLTARARVMEEMIAVGEGSSIGGELALVLDEMRFLVDLYRRLELDRIARTWIS